MDAFEAQIHQFSHQIESELAEGQLSCPTFLDLSLRIKQVADDPGSSMNELAELVRAEPVLSARVVRLANAVGVNPGGVPVTSVPIAVQRIGLLMLRTLAFGVSLEQLAQDNRSRQLRLLAGGLWMHSVDVAAHAYALSRLLKIGAPDTALFAGILRNVGQFFLLAHASRYPLLEEDVQRFSDFIATWEEPVRNEVLKAFDLPEPLLAALNQDIYGASWPPRSLGDVLFVAALAAATPNPFGKLNDDYRRELLAAATRGIDPAQFDALLASAETERRAILSAVCG